MANSDIPTGPRFALDGAEVNRLYQDVEDEVSLPSHVMGGDALKGVLSVLDQRLSGGEARDVVKALPLPVQRYLLRGPRDQSERSEVFGLAGFIERVAAQLKTSIFEAEPITRAVFEVLQRWLPDKEIMDVAGQLPTDIRQVWLEPVAAPNYLSTSDDEVPPDGLASTVLDELRASGLIPEGASERQAIRVVMFALTDRISRGEARDLLMALPPGLRPLLERRALQRAESPQLLDRQALLQRVAQALDVPPDRAEAITRAVFTAVQKAIPPRAIHHVTSQLPRELQDLWTGTPVAHEHAAAPG